MTTFLPTASSPMIGAGSVCDDLVLGDRVPHLDQRALIDAAVLVRALELAHAVDVDTGVTDLEVLGGTDHDPLGIDLVDYPGPLGLDCGPGVDGNLALDASAHQGRVGRQQRQGLAHHVRPHQGAVGVVVFKKRDQRGRHRDQLLGADVDQVHVLVRRQGVFPVLPRRDQIVDELHVGVEVSVRLGDRVAHLLGGGHVVHLVGNLAVLDDAIGGLDEAVLVHPRIGGQRVDQANVRPFRRLDRAHPAVMGRVHVAHLEAGALARQAAGPERRQAALVRDLGQRVGLVHELRQLRGAEEFAHRGRGRLGVDQVLRHDGVDLDAGHALLDRALHAQQADAVLVLHQFAHGAHPAVAEVVDIVDIAAAVAQTPPAP